MKEIICPNTEVCKLVIQKDFIHDETRRLKYINKYCEGKLNKWNKCTRYIVKNEINFCPDFVMPDSVMTSDEVIDQFDKQNL